MDKKQQQLQLKLDNNWKRRLKIRPLQVELLLLDFLQRFCMLLSASIPMATALSLLSKQNYQGTKFDRLIKALEQQVQEGQLLSDAMALYPQTFNQELCSVIRLGEQSGSLIQTLTQYRGLKHEVIKVKQDFMTACRYPLILMIVSLFVVSFIIVTVIPNFILFYQQIGSELPWLTKRLLSVFDFFQTYYGLLIGFTLISFMSFNLIWSHPKAKISLFRQVVKLPIIGTLLTDFFAMLAAQYLLTCYLAGIIWSDAIILMSQSIKIPGLTKQGVSAKEKIWAGFALHLALQEITILPKSFIEMIAIGEKSGKLEDILLLLVEQHRQQNKIKLAWLKSYIEPLLILGIGIMICVLIIALYQPIFSLGLG